MLQSYSQEESALQEYLKHFPKEKFCPQQSAVPVKLTALNLASALKMLKRIFSRSLCTLASRVLWFSWLLEDEAGHRKGQQIVPPHAQANPRQQWASISMNWPIFVIEVSYWHRVRMVGAMGSASGACHQAAGAEHSVHTLWIRAWFNTAWLGRLQKSHFQNTQGSLQGNILQKLERDKEHPMTVSFIMLLSKKIVEHPATKRNPTRAWGAFQNIFRHHTVTKIPFTQKTLQ